MPESDDNEDEELPTMARPEMPFTSPPPNPVPALERARLSQPPMKRTEPAEKITRSGPEMPDLTAPARAEQQTPAVEKPKFSFFPTPAPKIVEEDSKMDNPSLSPMEESKPSFSLFGKPVEEPAPRAASEKPSFSLFGKQPEVMQEAAPIPAPPPLVEKPSFSVFENQPEEVQNSAPPSPQPAPADEKKSSLSLLSKPDSTPSTSPEEKQPSFSLSDEAPVQTPPTKSELTVPDTMAGEPSPALSAVQEQPKGQKQQEVVPTVVENSNPLDGTAAPPLETTPQRIVQPSETLAEPAKEPTEPVVAVEQPMQSAVREEPGAAAKAQSASIETSKARNSSKKVESQVPINPSTGVTTESLPPISSSFPNLRLDRINIGLSPLVVVPFGALAAGRSILASRESKQKELEEQLQRIQDRRKKELSSSNAYVFVSA